MNTAPHPQPAHSTPPASPSLDVWLTTMAHVISAEGYPAADRAALKRWAPEQEPPLAFYRLWLRHVHDKLPDEPALSAWMTLAWALALFGHDGHRPDRPWGQVLAEADFAEARLERLLSAPQDIRIPLCMGAVRFLATRDLGFDMRQMLAFLLAHDADKRQALHRRIAQDYYRNLSKE